MPKDKYVKKNIEIDKSSVSINVINSEVWICIPQKLKIDIYAIQMRNLRNLKKKHLSQKSNPKAIHGK